MNQADYLDLEMALARVMARQEAAGFKLDLDAAERISEHLNHRFDQIKRGLEARFPKMKGKLKMPKVSNKKRGVAKGCPYIELIDFNPTSRVHIAHALQTLGVRFEARTEGGQIKIDESVLAEVFENHRNAIRARKAARSFAKLLKIQKWLGQLSGGSNAWLKMIEEDGCIHHACSLATQTGRNAHRNPNLGQVNSAQWARALFIPHEGHTLVGVDLAALELRCLGHYLSPYDNGAFSHVVVNGDIHQQNADRVGCTRKQVKGLTFGFVYGAGDLKLGKILYPTLSESSQRTKGKEIRQKFLDAIPGLEPLIEAVRSKVRTAGMLRGLDGRPIFCSAEHASLNYLLQGSGAVVSKRWVVIAYSKLLEKYQWGKDFTFCAYVHDEIQASCRPEIADDVIAIIEESALLAGQHYNFRIPITAEGSKGANWRETH